MNYGEDIKNCLEVLKEGGIILYPTDTIWGIGCDATNEAAVKKIYELKHRAESKSMIILLADEKEIGHYAKPPSPEILMMLHEASGPLTVVFPDAVNLAPNLISPDNTIAMRVPHDDFCILLLCAFKKPIVSTSANISGGAAPRNFNDIATEIKNGVDFIVQHRQDDESLSSPSRIVQWTKDEKLIVIRE